MFTPYLSVVAASRNDDHGGDPLIRTQIFINNLARQCEKYRLPAELIVVDWNPVPDRRGLSAVLSMPLETSYCSARVITVPSALHHRLKYADKLPFFQMIAKNVGIRRARGNFILATNIDIVFSDELIQFIARQKLDPKKMYRVDRYDMQSGLSKDRTLDETLEYAWANPIRAHRRYQPERLLKHLYCGDLFKKACIPDAEFRGVHDGVEVFNEDGIWQVRPDCSVEMSHLHTNACGDFTLLSHEGWDAIRGYPEFEAFSFNIDSIGLVAAHFAGYAEVSLLPPCVCFHIEHGIGSGWTPEGEKKLFDRLRDAGILNPEWPVLMPLVDEMRGQGKSLEFNHAGWGMADFDLPEQTMGDSEVIPVDKLNQLALQAQNREVSAIQPAYDLDRLTLACERRVALEQSLANQEGFVSNIGLTVASSGERQPILGSTVAANTEKIVLYIPDSTGCYSENRSIAYHACLLNTTTVIFRLEQFARQFPLRFDPCQCPGFININSIAIFDTVNHKMVWELDSRDSRNLLVGGTAVPINNALRSGGGRVQKFFRTDKKYNHQPLRMISTGVDPQLILPPLPDDVGFPLVISVEMNLLPSE